MFKKVWDKIKKWWKAIVGGLVVLVGLAFFWQRRRVGKVRDELALARAKDEITVLKGYRDRLLREGKESTEEIEKIDEAIQQNKRDIIEAHENAEGMSDDEVEAEFARLGY